MVSLLNTLAQVLTATWCSYWCCEIDSPERFKFDAWCQSLDHDYADYRDETRQLYYTSKTRNGPDEMGWELIKHGAQPPPNVYSFHSVYDHVILTAMVVRGRTHHMFCDYALQGGFWCDYAKIVELLASMYVGIVLFTWTLILCMALYSPVYREKLRSWTWRVGSSSRPLALMATATLLLVSAGLLRRWYR